MIEQIKTYPCACCLEDKPKESYYFSKQGKRYLTCRECKRMQQRLCKRLEELGHRFGVGVFASLERTRVIQMLLDAGTLKPNEIPRTSLLQRP